MTFFEFCLIQCMNLFFFRKERAEKELQLRTKAMRERDALQEVRKYNYTLIRIRFPDNSTLQMVFRVRTLLLLELRYAFQMEAGIILSPGTSVKRQFVPSDNSSQIPKSDNSSQATIRPILKRRQFVPIIKNCNLSPI